MAPTPDPNASFYREVDDELRRSRMGSFWSRYGIALIAGLVVVALLAAGYAYWQSRQRKEADRQSEVLDSAITALGAGNEKAAAPKLAELAASDNPGYRASALLSRADLALGEGRQAEAVGLYRQVAADADMPQPYRDLALVRQTAAEFDSIAPALVIQRLQALAKPGNPWFGSAGEMTGVAYLKQQKPALAAPLFAAIAKDEGVPESIRSRVVQMAGTLGVDAIEDQASPDPASQDKAPPAAQRN